MKLNRSLIKTQAKELIKGNVLSLFLITFVVFILTSSLSLTISINSNSTDKITTYNNAIDGFDGYQYHSNDQFDNDLAEFFNNSFTSPQKSKTEILLESILNAIAFFATIIQFLMIPLSVTLIGVYIMLVHGNKLKIGESFNYVFKFTFDKNYWNKLLCVFVQKLIETLLMFLFIIPGIIFYYRYYFANIILADNPNLSAKQAVKLSIKMTDGHKGELFALDLSFIGWAILTAFTFGVLSIYVIPYAFTTKTLYYENFKARAFAEGVLTQRDFEEDTFDEPQSAQQNGPYYTPQQNSQQNSQFYTQQQFTQPVEPKQTFAEPVAPVVEPVQTFTEPIIQSTPQQTTENATHPVINVENATSDNTDFGTGLDNDYYNTNV